MSAQRPPDSLSIGLAPVQRWKHEFQKASGSREMVEHEDGEWMHYEDLKCAMIFVTSYLHEHRQMLERLGAHKKIVGAVSYIINEIEKL
jgi:hypothetical protein